MSDLNGMHVADGQQYHIEQMCRAASGSVTILDFLLKDSDLRPFGHNGTMKADVENCNWYGVLRSGRTSQGIPASDRIIHVRQYHPDWRLIALHMDSTDPAQWTINVEGIKKWAQHAVDRLSSWQGANEHHQMHADLFLDPRVAISPFNEQDIEPAWVNYMQTKQWYDLIGKSALVWLEEINHLRPDRKCLTMTPALAGGHEPYGDAPDSEYTLPAMREMLSRFDVIGAHCYGLLNQAPTRGMFGADAKWYGLRLWRGLSVLAYPDADLSLKNAADPGGLVFQARQLGRRVHISEAGTFRHDDKGYVDENWRHMSRFLDAASRSQNVTGVDWFIWNSNSAHSGNRIWYSEGLREKLEKAPRYLAASWPTVRDPAPPVDIPVDPPKPPTQEPPVAFNPNPYGLDIYRDPITGEWGAIGAMLVKFKDEATTDEIRIKGAYSQLVWTMGVSGRLYLAWQNTKEPYAPWRSTWIESGATVAARLAKAAA